jgi:hypothetical protein
LALEETFYREFEEIFEVEDDAPKPLTDVDFDIRLGELIDELHRKSPTTL